MDLCWVTGLSNDSTCIAPIFTRGTWSRSRLGLEAFVSDSVSAVRFSGKLHFVVTNPEPLLYKIADKF